MKVDGNEYLLELVKNDEKALLNLIFSSSFFLTENAMLKYQNENNYIRNGQSHTLYYKRENQYYLIRRTKNFKRRLKDLSKNDLLFLKDENENFKAIKIDSTGNAAPRKFLQENIGQNLLNRNFKISHLENKGNTPEKHGFKNIVITPTFLDHFFDRNLSLNEKKITNIAKLVLKYKYNLGETFFKDFYPTKEEIDFAKSTNFNFLDLVN
ncbi:hypothetical protein [Chryseobacterium oryzae]|uniref:Uncharacterized protein n=1 Tax=Chryseobacterium oryzae TaxID=2929799 RepID=A0ABY4BKG7_9FLAO|nr:hypothetical protein [Chryseobacterium oryzae]UOE39696.1 hypothetical protein MTP08_14710 [Chryseobacterium oryzae]